MSRKFIIDTDTASDDAVALLMALAWPDVTVDAITVVYGNVPLAQASVNARYTLEVAQRELDFDAPPVYNGCDRPLLRTVEHADWFHGADGMGNRHYPAPQTPAADEHAVDELIRRFGAAPGEITLVTLGPLTNIAVALRREPRLAEWVQHGYVMGGAACTVGNVTPAAEYNIWCDPEAAHIVFHSGMKLTMIGWELCRGEANLKPDEMQSIYDIGTERAQFAMDCNRRALEAVMQIQLEDGLALADPVAMAVALEPEIATRSLHYVDIACDEALTRGMTVVDQLHVTNNEPNVEVCWGIDVARWKAMLRETLG